MNKNTINEMSNSELNDKELEGIAGGSSFEPVWVHKGCPLNGKMEYTASGVRCTGCDKKFSDTSQFIRIR